MFLNNRNGDDSVTLSKILVSHKDIVKRAQKNLGTFSTTHMEGTAQSVFHNFAVLNAIDTSSYPELLTFEKKSGEFFLNLFHAENHNDYQAISTSGSSEAIFMALLFMKHFWRLNNPKSKQTPNFIVGTNGHIAWHKAATYLEVELRFIPVHLTQLTMDESQILMQIDHNTIGVACTLGATTTLLFDPVEKINTLLQQYFKEHSLFIPLHVDAASGGCIAPFLNLDLKWDFRLSHVMSINVSSHKFGLVYPSLGWLCVRNEISDDNLAHESHYIGKTIKRYPIQFSHSAAHIATQYYYTQTLGVSGYEKIIKNLFSITSLLVEKLRTIDEITLLRPENISHLPGVVLSIDEKFTKFKLGDLASNLAAKGWHLPIYRLPAPLQGHFASRIVVRYGYNEKLIEELWRDISNYFLCS